MKSFSDEERDLIASVYQDVKMEKARSDKVKQLYDTCLQQLQRIDPQYWSNVKQIRNFIHNHHELQEDDCNSELTSLTLPPTDEDFSLRIYSLKGNDWKKIPVPCFRKARVIDDIVEDTSQLIDAYQEREKKGRESSMKRLREWSQNNYNKVTLHTMSDLLSKTPELNQ